MNAVNAIGLLSCNMILITLLYDGGYYERDVKAPYGMQGGRLSADMATWLAMTVLFMLARNLRSLYFIPALGPLLLIMQLIVYE